MTLEAHDLGVPELLVFRSIGSTQDAAHERAAAGAASGTLIVADEQSAGRGRHGRHWTSAPGSGVWCTLIERPVDPQAVDVLSLRIGLTLAESLEPLAGRSVRLKWPNDLMIDDGKLGGILIEARWRDGHPEWVAIGVGINLVAPGDQPNAAALGVWTRDDVLARIVPAMRTEAARTGLLDGAEVADFAARDWARGRRAVEPVAGTVQGIDSFGALLIAAPHGVERVRSGSLVLAEDS